MKPIIPSNFLDILMSKLKELSSKIQDLIPAGVKELIPPKYRKWLPVAALALVLILLLVCCSPKAEPAEDPVLYTVYTDNLNVHKEHDADSSIVGQLPEGLEIQVLEIVTADGNEWGRIDKTKLPDGTKVKAGWINMKHTEDPSAEEPEPTDPEPEITPVEATMGTVITGKLNVRKGAGSKYEAFDAYYEGDRIEILETVEEDGTVWGRTSKGWVGMGYVRMDGTPPAKTEESEGSEESEEPKIDTDGNYIILGYGVVDLGELNVRSGPGTDNEKVAVVHERTRYAYYQISGDWVRIESGWVNTEYFYLEGITAEDALTGTVTTDDLNVRTGPDTSFKRIGALKSGETVEILGQVDGWGYTQDGWINMNHVETTYSTGTGTILSGLNIRKEPDADSEKVGSYYEGDRVTILEVNGQWGMTDQGWINLKYVKYD